MTRIDVLGAFLIAATFSFLATPIVRWLAFKTDFVDHPSGKKVHAQPMPLLGGLAIYFAVILALSFTLGTDRIITGVLVASTFIMVMGIIDDKFGIMPKYKLLGQIAAALIAIRMGLDVAFIKNPYISIPFTVIWLVGMTNAFNLIDNINGLSAGIAGISAFFFGIIAYFHGNIMIAVLSFALMGGCLGFLPHNFPNARIFMGDTGSLFLGFVLASIAVGGSWKTSSLTTSLAVPIFILGYPIFDMSFVMITRLLKGEPISKGGKDHSSHRLAQAAIEAVRDLEDRKDRSVGSAKILVLAICQFVRGLKKKGDDRAANRLANLGFKKKRAVLVLYVVSFLLGLAAFLMTILGKYFDFTIMTISGMVMALLGIRLAMVKIDEKSMSGIDNLIILAICILIVGLPVSNSIVETAAIAAIVLWLFKKLFISRNIRVEKTPLNLPILFYLVFVAISFINTQFFMTSLKGFAFKTVEHFLLFFAIIDMVNTESDVKKIISAVLFSCALIGLDGLWQYASGYDFLRGYPLWSSGRITASFKYPNGLGSWLITVMPLCISLAIFDAKKETWKFSGILLSLLLLACMILNITRGAIAAFLSALFFLLWMKGRKARRALFLVVLLLALGAVAIAVFSNTEFVSRIIIKGHSTSHRIALAEMCLEMFADHPFIGHGINTFMSIYETYAMPSVTKYTGVSYAHNCYLQIAVETGIFSLLAFMWLIGAFFVSSLKDIKSRKPGFIKSVEIGLAGGLLAYLGHSAIETNLYSLPLALLFYSFLGLAVSIQKIDRKVSNTALSTK